jgi:hypothetical protein
LRSCHLELVDEHTIAGSLLHHLDLR